MLFTLTTATRRVAALTKKVRAVQGGTSASKTVSILLHLIHEAQSDSEPTLTSVVSETIPHLKRGALRDFKNILKGHGYWREERWNATDSIYTFETGSQIEFFSADNADKLRGGRRDRCFINEANNVSFDAFEQLEVRTKEYVYLDWNPTNEFWFYTEVLPHRDDVEHIILTYRDNEALSQEIIDSIEQRRHRAQWWKVYGEGQLGEVENRVFTGWAQIDAVPHEARLERFGLDFGYSNDPTAILTVYRWNDAFILDELLYRKGMHNKPIAEVILAEESDRLTIADSAEPKSIDEIKSYGVPIVGAAKGQGSIRQGINIVQDQRIFVTRRSINTWREYSNYLWRRDKDGKILGEPEEGFNHAMDAARYAIVDILDKKGGTDVADFYKKLKERRRKVHTGAPR